MPHGSPNLGKDCLFDICCVVPRSCALCATCHPPAELERGSWSHRWPWFPTTTTQINFGGYGRVICPFCIMLLYQYLLHYGLLLHIMSQYLCLFSLLLQGLHEKGECRQLEFWDRKGANIRDLFCTTPKVLKLHRSYFWN